MIPGTDREPIGRDFMAAQFQFGDFTLDHSRYRLQRGAIPVRLEKIPMELLILLVQRSGQLVSREEIAKCLWGKDVFVDIDHSINVAIRKIRVGLRDDPAKPGFVETVVGKGYRFAAHVTASSGDSIAEAAPSPEIAPPASVIPPPARGMNISWAPKVLLAGFVLLVLLAGIWFLHRARTSNVIAHPSIKSLAVLPLNNLSGDPTQDYLVDGITEALIGRLAGIHDLRVISRTSVMRFKQTSLSVPEIAKTLGVEAIVEGSVIREGSRIRVHAQLIRGATDGHIWSETYDRELRDVLALESEVAQSIAKKVEVTVTGEEHERLRRAPSVSPEVYESYLKGRFALSKANSKGEIEESISYFEEALKRDPRFAPAYVGVASANSDLSTVFVGARPEKPRQAALNATRKALEIDPDSAEAHAILADLEEDQWHWTEAEAEYRRALELNPSNAAAHNGLSGWMLCQGRTDESLTWANRGRELDPLAVSGADMGWILFHARRYDEAVHELRSFLAIEPNDAGALLYLGFVLVAKNQPEDAIPVLENALTLSGRSPGVIGVLIRAYAHAGRRADALKLLAELEKRKKAEYVPAGAFVNAYLGLDDRNQSFRSLEQAYNEKSAILRYIKVHPFFDPLRDDPRFADLIRRVGLD